MNKKNEYEILEKEKKKCIQSVPPRFRYDASDALEFADDMRTINKAWDYFLMDILDEMTLDEKIEYGFTTSRNVAIEMIAKDIIDELIYDNWKTKTVSDDSIEKECYLVVADIKNDIKNEILKDLKLKNFEVI